MGCDQQVNDKPSTTTSGVLARTRTRAARYAQRLEATTLGRMWSRLLEVEFVDRSIALAAKAFVSFLPLLVIVSALSPDNVRDKIVGVFRLPDQSVIRFSSVPDIIPLMMSDIRPSSVVGSITASGVKIFL